MDSQFAASFKKLNQRQSIFCVNTQIDEQRDQQLSDTQVDRSRQRHLFELQNNKLQQSHNGDSDIQESSFQGRISSSVLELKHQSSALRTLQSSIIDEINQINQINQDKENDETDINVEFRNDIDSQDYKSKQSQQENDSVLSGNSIVVKKLSSKINSSEQQCFNSQDQSKIIGSQNTIVNRENMSQKNSSDIQRKSYTKTNINGKIWLQEDIFYEKNFKKLGTKVTFELKNQYQEESENNKSTKHQQNFKKAANIINRLLNTSMSRVMKIRQHVENFVNLLKLRHANRRIDDLKENEFLIINDLCYFYNQNDKNTKNYQLSIIFNCFLKLMQILPIFMPTDVIRVFWDMIQVMFTYSFLYIYSLLIFFDQNDFKSENILRFYYFSFIMFSVDIIINLNTALFNKDNIITKQNQKHIIKLINQIASVITAAHIASIGWYFLGIQEQQNNQSSWLDKLAIKDHPYYEKYAYSIYWSITTMTTGFCLIYIQDFFYEHKLFYLLVGYGDIAATNYIEALYISVVMILFSCVFAYSINNIGFILQEIEKSSKQLNDDITIIQRYLIRKDVNIQLKSRVRHYLSFLAYEQKDRDKQAEDKILSVLSNKLREEITFEINSKILNNYFLFSSNFTQTTLNRLIFIMEEVLVNPNEVLIREKQFDDSAIYFIQSGIIEIYSQQLQSQNKINVIKVLRDGQIFGELSFFSGLQRQASARSVNLSTLYKINRSKFIEILKENTEDFEKFKMMQDQIIFQHDLQVIHTECYTCKNIGHMANQCPKTHRIKDQQLIIVRQNYSTFQERAHTERKNKKLLFQAKNQIKQNRDLFTRLKMNLKLQNDQCYLLFQTNENLLTSECSQSKYQNDDDDDEDDQSLSQIPFYFDQQSINSQNFSKAYSKKKTEQLIKTIKKVNNFQQQSNTENESQVNLENQCHSNKSLNNQEIFELKKAQSNTLCSYAKTQSLEATENVNSNVKQESSFNAISSKNAQVTEYNCQAIYKNDTDSFKQNTNEDQSQLQNLQNDEGQVQLKSSQHNFNIVNQYDQEKKQLKQGSNNSILNIQYSNKILFQQVEDQNQLIKDSQILPQNFTDNQNKTLTSVSMKSKQIKSASQKSQKLLTQSQKETRCSVEQMLLQNNILNDLVCDKRVSSLQLKNRQSYLSNIQEIIDKCINNTNKSSKDSKEKTPSQQSNSGSNLFNNQNMKDQTFYISNNQQQIQQNQQQNQNNNNGHNKSDIEIMKKLSKIMQNSNIPLLLQLANGKSFLQSESQVLSNSMDQFDRLQQFKKYFTHNNFEQVISKLKKFQQVQKKQKKNKLASKQRRYNIGLVNNNRLSIFHGNSNLIKFMPQEYDINQYKPTHLSYGVKMQNGAQFPINLQFISNN
ncbi:hypothetical protein ABPG72_009344 [Tetrahymena utriculariae]